jgi:hypothetical protein
VLDQALLHKSQESFSNWSPANPELLSQLHIVNILPRLKSSIEQRIPKHLGHIGP